MLDMETYRQDLFDVFEGTTLDTYKPTPTEEYELAMEDTKDKVKGSLSDKNPVAKVTKVMDKGYNKVTKTISNKTVGEISRRVVKTPEERAKENGQQFPDNTHYMAYANDVTKAARIMNTFLNLPWIGGWWAVPGTATAVAGVAAVENKDKLIGYLLGNVSAQEALNAGLNIVRVLADCLQALQPAVPLLAALVAKASTDAYLKPHSSMLKALQAGANVAINKMNKLKAVADNVTESVLKKLKAVLSSSASYAYNAKEKLSKINKKDKTAKESVDEVITESYLDKEEMDVLTQLKFAAFENAEDNNPYLVLDEIIEKCNYDSERDLEILDQAFEFVLAL